MDGQPQGKTDSEGITLVSPWEELVFTWQVEPIAQVLKREKSRGRTIAKIEEPPLFSPPISCKFLRLESQEEVEWESYVWQPEGHGQTGRASGARVVTLARRLIARERARTQRRKPADLLAHRRGRKLLFK